MGPVAKDAFAQTFRTYRREIDSYFLKKTRDPALSEDLTQETFARLAARARETGDIAQERPYLYRIAHNLLMDYLRSRRRGGGLTDTVEDIGAIRDDAPTPEALLTAHQDLERMKSALLRLPQRTREVFVRVRLDGQSYRQAAQEMKISESSVQKHLAMAVAHLAQTLRGNRP